MSEDATGEAGPLRLHDSRWSPLFIVVAALFGFCILCDFALIRATAPTADSVQNFNELSAVFAGNPLLGHWVLASDSFYFTDLPLFALGRLLIGDRIALIYLVPFAIYALLLAAGLVLVWRGPPRGRGISALILLALIGAPFAPGQYMLRIAAFHTASVLFSLVALAAIAPVVEGRGASAPRWAIFAAALFIACASDPMATVFLALPFLAFLLLDVLRQRALPRPYLVLGLMVVAGIFAAGQFPPLMEGLGGFVTRPSYSGALSLDPEIVFGNLRAELAAFGVLLGVTDLGALPLAPIVSVLRAVTALWVLASVASLVWRTRSAPRLGLARLLVIAALALLAADTLSITFAAAITDGPGYPNAAVRYVAPAFIFLCIAAALEPAYPTSLGRLRRILAGIAATSAVVVFIAVAVLSYRDLLAPPGLYAPPAYRVTVWLRERRLTYGVGDYYTTQLVRALSDGQVMADPMVVEKGRLVPDRFWTDTKRFDAGKRPQFVIFPDENWFDLTPADAVATYGPPLRTAWVSGVRVMIYAPAPL
jgi:hypothetical protein